MVALPGGSGLNQRSAKANKLFRPMTVHSLVLNDVHDGAGVDGRKKSAVFEKIIFENSK